MSYNMKILTGNLMVSFGYTLAGAVMYSPNPNWILAIALMLFGVAGAVMLGTAQWSD